jgi:hypothetical protein
MKPLWVLLDPRGFMLVCDREFIFSGLHRFLLESPSPDHVLFGARVGDIAAVRIASTKVL